MSAWGLRGVTVRYGRRVALDDVTMTVTPGQIAVVIGGDGAGKTTLLRALTGTAPVATGAVRRPDRRRIGYVSGAAGLYHDLSVAENIEFVAKAYGMSGPDLATRRAELLRKTDLTDATGRLAGRLSGGMRQKLAFALAMLHTPDLLVLDEPTTGVDPVSRAELWRLIAGAAAGGAALVISTTYLDEAQRGTQVVLLEDGRIAAAGTADEVAAELPEPAMPRRSSTAGPSLPSAPALAACRGLTRRFGAATAVDGVDLEVHGGEIVGLIGANGAGKTTLIRMLLGLLRPTSGTARLFAQSPSRDARRRLGYVPQGLGLWDDLTVAENLAFSAGAFGGEPPGLDADLDAARDRLVRDLPLGLRRRLAFAAALAHQPELLVLDEPTSGVDPVARAALWATIREAAAEGAGVIVTTHHLDETEYCDRLVMMAQGRVVAAGGSAAIVGARRAVTVETGHWDTAYAALEHAGLPAALVGRTLRVPADEAAEPEVQAARVRAALDAAGLAAELRIVPATLEETFVALSGAADG